MSFYRSKRCIADPHWTTARFSSVCSCGNHIAKGDRIFYYPSNRTATCEKCGKHGDRDLQSEKSFDQYGTDIF